MNAEPHRAGFYALTPAEQRLAIARLVDEGHSEYTAAAATGVSVEMVRAVLTERPAKDEAA